MAMAVSATNVAERMQFDAKVRDRTNESVFLELLRYVWRCLRGARCKVERKPVGRRLPLPIREPQ